MIWKVYGRKHPWPDLRYYPDIFLEGLNKTMKTVRTARTFRYQAGVLTSGGLVEAIVFEHWRYNTKSLRVINEHKCRCDMQNIEE
jgi:hypothetical protein